MTHPDAIAWRARLPQRRGCAWLLRPRDAAVADNPEQWGGWCAVAGAPALRFRAAADLDPDIRWWTNLTREEVWAAGRWSTWWDRDAWGVPATALWAEMGQDPDDEDAWPAAVTIWSEVAARLADRISATPAVRADGGNEEEGSLPEDIAFRWPPARASADPTLTPVWAAVHAGRVMLDQGPWRPGHPGRHAVLSLDRRNHLLDMLASIRQPRGAWREVPERECVGLGAADALRRHPRPLLVCCAAPDWHPGQESAAHWWGQQGQRFTRSLRTPIWITADEAADLATVASIRIESAYEAEAWGTPASLTEVCPWDVDAPLAPGSLLLGILAAAAWVAQALPVRHPRHRARQPPPATAPWWRAADHRNCATAARALAAAGATVVAYGAGTVTVAAPVDPERLAAPARAAGLLLPHAWHAAAPPPVTWVETLRAADPIHRLNVDRLVAPWPGQARDMRALLRQAAGALVKLPAFADPVARERLRQQTQVAVADVQARQG